MMTIKRGSEAGFTLIELMVGALLTVLVLSLVGGIVLSSTRSEGIVRSVAQATEAGQLVTSSVQNGIRNSALSLNSSVPFKLTTPTGSDQLLVALVVSNGATATASCAAWYYSATAGEVRYTTSNTAIAAPSSTALATWTLLSTGVAPIPPSTTIFSTPSTYKLNLTFQAAAGDASPIPFQSSITSRTAMSGAIACF